MKAYEYKLQKQQGTGLEAQPIAKAEDAYNFAKKFYQSDIGIYESMFLILLNRAGKAVGWCKISQGGVCGTLCDVRIIAKYAIDSLSPAVILVHNHPSGNVQPSVEDRKITTKVKETLKIFDCQLTDHIVISEDSFYSFLDNGVL